MVDCKTIDGVSRGSVTNFPLHIVWVEPQPDTTKHEHSFTELVLILSGKSVHHYEKTVRPVEQGDVLIIPPGVFHYYSDSTDDFSLVNIVFLSDQMPIPLIDLPLLPGFHPVFHGKSDNPECPYLHLSDEKFIHIRNLAVRLMEEDINRTPGYRFTMLSIFMMILSGIVRDLSHEHGRNPQIFLHINGVISYLNRHFKEPCPISKLCQVAGMSRATLQRNFQNATGTSPRQYQLQLRIAEATTLLQTTDKTMDDIAAELGFGNQNYFSRQFKKIAGKSPVMFRKQK